MSEAKAKYLAAKAAFEETFEKHLQNGVEFISDQVFIDPEVEIAPGAVILPGCILRGKTVIGANCVIGPNTLLENTIVEAGSTVNASQCYDSHLGPNNKIGPFTHVRTGTVTDEGVHLGAYVETKNANFAEGNTVSHLTYIGDADVGKYCNFGCGTVTCNYDGEGKYLTTIGDYAFIGCDAIDSSGDVYSENMAVALVEKTVLLNAKHKYILCDSSKIGKTAVAHIVNLRECDGIVTANLENGIAENFKFLTEVIYA